MDIFDALEMIGGLCLFIFGMNIMGQALERRAGSRLRTTLSKMTGKTMTGFLTGLVVTAIIQSSSATTVMVVGFVNSGLMTLKQAIGVIMGENIGTTVTSWLLSLGGISGDAVWVQLLKPTSFTPVLALVGIIMYMFSKDSRKNDTGMILLGFATLMFGMETMSGAVSGLRDVPAFRQMFIAFTNPLLGVLAGAAVRGCARRLGVWFCKGVVSSFAETSSWYNRQVLLQVCGCGRKPKSMPDEGKGIHVSPGVRVRASMARPRGKSYRPSYIRGIRPRGREGQ